MARSDDVSSLKPFLERLLSRSKLSPVECEAILGLPAHERIFEPHRDIGRLGDNRSHSSLVLKGLVGRFMQNSRGDRQLTALHLAGEMADLDGVVRPDIMYGLEALATTTIAQVPHQALRALAQKHSAIAEAFWRESASDVINLSRWALHLGRGAARTRVANLLCEMAVRMGSVDAPELEFSLPLTQDQLSDATGLTAVHVNRTLKSLREEGIVTYRLREVRISNWEALAVEGEFNLSEFNR
jgi:CRP-like cAMP-binding protein